MVGINKNGVFQISIPVALGSVNTWSYGTNTTSSVSYVAGDRITWSVMNTNPSPFTTMTVVLSCGNVITP